MYCYLHQFYTKITAFVSIKKCLTPKCLAETDVKMPPRHQTWRQNHHTDVLHVSHLTPPHVRQHFLAPVGFMEIPVRYARKWVPVPQEKRFFLNLIMVSQYWNFIITFPSSWYHWNTVRKEVKLADIYSSSFILHEPAWGKKIFSKNTKGHTCMSHVVRKPVYAICEQQRHRSACASAQSDQHLCCSLPR